MEESQQLAILRRTLKELRSKGFDLEPVSWQRQIPCSQAGLPFKSAEFFQDDPHLLAAEGALRRIRCLPSLAAALAWVKATNPQQARDLNNWPDKLAFYAGERLPPAEFQQQLDQWVQAHQVVAKAFLATVMASASRRSGGLRSGVDAHGQLRLWPAEDFDPTVAGQAVQECSEE